jgi:hypothetical protein
MACARAGIVSSFSMVFFFCRYFIILCRFKVGIFTQTASLSCFSNCLLSWYLMLGVALVYWCCLHLLTVAREALWWCSGAISKPWLYIQLRIIYYTLVCTCESCKKYFFLPFFRGWS